MSLVRMSVYAFSAAAPDPPPDTNKACTSEEVTLDSHLVELPHVPRSIDPPQMHVSRKYFKLRGVIGHVKPRFKQDYQTASR
jgi:hypothetical protein